MATPPDGRISRWSVALRSKPHKDPAHPYQGIIVDLPRGTQVKVTGQQGGWLAVTATLEGRTYEGYIAQETVARGTPHAPKMYYELVPSGNGLIVNEVPAHKLHSGRKVLTEAQLREQLRHHSVPTVSASAMAGYVNSLHHLQALDCHAPGTVSKETGTAVPTQNKWRGSLGELAAQHKGLLPQRNLNIIHANHPVFDLKGQLGELNSVKTSVRNPSAAGDPYSTYLDGMADMLGVNSGKFARARTLLYPQLPAAEGTALMLRDGYLSVNSDHVKPFQAALQSPANYTKKAYAQLANQLLRAEPVRINGVQYRSYQALTRLQQASGTSSAVGQQIETALRGVRQKLASSVQSNGITSLHLSRLLNFRRQVGLANPQMSSAQLKTWLFPELLITQSVGPREAAWRRLSSRWPCWRSMIRNTRRRIMSPREPGPPSQAPSAARWQRELLARSLWFRGSLAWKRCRIHHRLRWVLPRGRPGGR